MTIGRQAGRQAATLSFLSAVLALTLAAQSAPAPAQPGLVVTGTATVQDARGVESGTITVESWDAGHCRITLDVSRPGVVRRWVAVLDGKRSQVTAPQALRQALAAPNAVHGCALLPAAAEATLAAASAEAAQSARQSIGAPALSLDPATRLPVSLSWQGRDGRVEVGYAAYTSSAGVAYPATVTETISGSVRLQVQFTAVTAKPDFTEADFALPPLHAPVTHGYGGGQ